MALERKDLELLAAPFPVEAHKFLNDMIYLHEEPICERLDDVDPSWQWEITSITTRPSAGEGGKDVGTVTVHGKLTIKGVSRDGVGMGIIQKSNPMDETKWDDSQKRKVKTGNQYTSEANEAEKAASTDAFKRAARMFGVGRYLLTMGKGVITDDKKLATWLKQHYPSLGKGKEYSEEVPDHSDILDGAWNEDEMKKFWGFWNKNQGIASETILAALGIEKLSQWGKSLDAADTAMKAYIEKIK